jgi:putative transposase
MERFFRSFKAECMPETGYQDFVEAEGSIINYIIGYYSSVRPHQHNNGKSPNEVE